MVLRSAASSAIGPARSEKRLEGSHGFTLYLVLYPVPHFLLACSCCKPESGSLLWGNREFLVAVIRMSVCVCARRLWDSQEGMLLGVAMRPTVLIDISSATASNLSATLSQERVPTLLPSFTPLAPLCPRPVPCISVTVRIHCILSITSCRPSVFGSQWMCESGDPPGRPSKAQPGR